MGLFDTPAPTAYPTSSTSSVSYPSYYQNAMQQVLNMGLAAANQPYQPFNAGPNAENRIAPIHDMQVFARDYFNNNLNGQQPAFNQAQSFLNTAAGQLGNPYAAQGIGTGVWGQSAADKYMSPYIGSVIDRAKRETNRDFDIQNNRVKDAAVAAGAFGGSRHGIVESELERQRGQRLDDITTTGLNNAYLNAQQIFGQDQNRDLQAQIANEAARRNAAALGLQNAQLNIAGSNAAQGLGRAVQTSNLANVDAGLNIGNIFRNASQQIRDFDYSEFLRQQGYDEGQANFLSGIVRGIPSTATTTSTGQQYVPGTSTASQIAGLGTTALGGLGL